MSETSERSLVPAPAINVESKPYWDAANEGQLMLGYCPACQDWHHYPRSICPFCHTAAELRPSGGTGQVYSHSATLRGAPEPYVIAYVELDEGPRMLTNIIGCAPLDVRIGQRVEVSFVAAEGGQRIPMFRPVAELK